MSVVGPEGAQGAYDVYVATTSVETKGHTVDDLGQQIVKSMKVVDQISEELQAKGWAGKLALATGAALSAALPEMLKTGFRVSGVGEAFAAYARKTEAMDETLAGSVGVQDMTV